MYGIMVMNLMAFIKLFAGLQKKRLNFKKKDLVSKLSLYIHMI